MSVQHLRIFLRFCILALLLTASSPLICWAIGWDLQWHRVPCWSNEFGQPEPPPATATPVAYPTAAPTWTWEPLPYQSPNATIESYPAPPTETLEPYPWGGIYP